jgi:hypothetical protein
MKAYGRLDVFSPEGDFISYTLDQPTVSVGRADGNVISLDTEALSRYHFSISYADGKVTITDLGSVNGTFVDGVQLVPNQPRELEGAEELQAGHLRLIYTPADDSPTIPAVPLTDDTHPSVVRETEIRLALDYPALDVWPASSTSTELAITNLTMRPRLFHVKTTGIQEKWIRVNRPELEIYPGDTAYVLVNVKPPRHPEVTPATYDVRVKVIPDDNPTSESEIPLQVMIRGYAGLGVALGNKIIESGDNARLYLHNQGNEPLNVVVTGHSPDGSVNFHLPSKPIALNAGQRIQVNGEITAKARPFTGAPREHPFHLRVKAQNAAGFLLVAEGKVAVKPLLPVWGMITAGGILISLLIIALLVMAGLLNPPEPQLTAVSVNADKIAQGEAILLRWTAENAASFSIAVNDQLLAELTHTASEYQIATHDQQGLLKIVLTARNGGKTVTSEQLVRVYLPLGTPSFTLEPDRVYSNVVTNLMITWDVPNAVKTYFSGGETFTNDRQLQEIYGASGQISNLAGITETGFTILLYAEDEVGNVQEIPLVVAVLNAECTATRPVSLLQAPYAGAPTVGSIANEQSISVVAQSDDRAWLKVALAGNVLAWGEAAAFQCPNFDVQALRMEVVPTATPSSTPTIVPPTATPTTIPPTATLIPTNTVPPTPRPTLTRIPPTPLPPNTPRPTITPRP